MEVAIIGLGIAAAAIAAFLLSSVYYAAATPIERRIVGDAALDRGRPGPWKVLLEVLRTAILAAAFAWIADRGGDLDISNTVVLALITWVGFPLVLLDALGEGPPRHRGHARQRLADQAPADRRHPRPAALTRTPTIHIATE